MSLTEAIESFIFHCTYEKNLSQKTLKAYTIDLAQFVDFITPIKTDVNLIDKHDLKAYIKILFEQELKEKSIKRKLATLKAFFGYLELEEMIVVSPFRKMKIQIKEPKRLPKTMELKEIRKLFKFLYKQKNEFMRKESYSYHALIRDIAVLELLFATGMRVAEACNLKLKDIDLNSGLVKIIGKGDKERSIQLCDKEVKEALKVYLLCFKERLAQQPYFFINRLGQKLSEQSIRFMIKKHKEKCGIEKHITPHMFRHSFATLLMEEGVDTRYIQHILGHASISTTQIYTQVNLRQQKKILAAKHPRKTFTTEL